MEERRIEQSFFLLYILTFILEYTMIITQYGKNVDGDSRSQRNGQRAGEGGNLVKVAGIEYHSEVAGRTKKESMVHIRIRRL